MSRFIIMLGLVGSMGYLFTAMAFAQTVSTITDAFPASGGVTRGLDGTLFVADYGPTLSSSTGANVYRVGLDGTVTLHASGFIGASGNTIDREGYLLQSSIRQASVIRVSPLGEKTTLASGLGGPIGIAVDSQDRVYIADCGRNTIYQVASNGTRTSFAMGALFNCPNGLTIDKDDNLYTANFGNGDVLKVSPSGQISRLATLNGANNGHLTYANDRLYVVARRANQLYEVSLSGQVTLLAGTGARGKADGPAQQATFSI